MQTTQKVFIQKINNGTINNEFANKQMIVDTVKSLRQNEEVSHNIKFLKFSTDKFDYSFGLKEGKIMYSKCVDKKELRNYVVFSDGKGGYELKWGDIKGVENVIYTGNDTRENAFSKMMKFIKNEA